MKAKKILYLLAGILKSIVGALGVLFGVIILLIGKLARQVFEASGEMLEEMFNELASIDEKYQYLVDAEVSVQLDFVMKICNIFAIIILMMGLIYITLSVINFIFAKKTGLISGEKKKSIWLCICSWVFSFLNISTILTTIAAALGKKKDKSSKNDVSIESYQV